MTDTNLTPHDTSDSYSKKFSNLSMTQQTHNNYTIGQEVQPDQLQDFNNRRAVDDVADETSMKTDSDRKLISLNNLVAEDTKANSEEDSAHSPCDDNTQIEKDQVTTQIQQMDSGRSNNSNPDEYETLVTQTQSHTGKITKDNFTMLQVLGTGSYGKVFLVKMKGTENHYAMKVLKKKQIRKLKQVQHTWTERKILEKINHPFIVKMRYAFQNERKLFFVLDYCPGGELFFYISQIGRFKETSAKFYAANIALALECLHENGVVYRDLKPENILIDKDGYAKLTDFGLSKDNLTGDNLANSFCGTAEYLAPEILNKCQYGKACDWWGFGCVVYEMLTGLPPFYSKKRQEIYENIRFKNPNFYSFHSPAAVDLLSKLLDKDPAKRLGTKGGAQEVKSHPFFQEIDFNQMYHKKLPTPYKPMLDSNTDTKHFDQGITQQPLESPTGEMVNSGGAYTSSYIDQEEFDGFSFEAHTIPSPTQEHLQDQQ